MNKFADNPNLGVGSTAFHEGGLTYNYEFVGIEHVSGMCQMFRRKCFEAIHGYSAIKSGGILRERLYTGRKDYLLGNHPVWEIFRSLYQMTHKPYFVGGLMVLASYLWNSLRGVKRTIPEELMAIRRSDQMKRLKLAIRARLSPITSAI